MSSDSKQRSSKGAKDRRHFNEIVARIFDCVDTNKDGSVAVKELRYYLNNVKGPHFAHGSLRRAQAVLTMFDTDGNGRLSQKEFVDAFCKGQEVSALVEDFRNLTMAVCLDEEHLARWHEKRRDDELILLFHKATNLPAGDLTNSSDPYVEFWFGKGDGLRDTKGRSGETIPYQSSVNPSWGEDGVFVVGHFKPTSNDLRHLRLAVWDKDTLSRDDLLGVAYFENLIEWGHDRLEPVAIPLFRRSTKDERAAHRQATKERLEEENKGEDLRDLHSEFHPSKERAYNEKVRRDYQKKHPVKSSDSVGEGKEHTKTRHGSKLDHFLLPPDGCLTLPEIKLDEKHGNSVLFMSWMWSKGLPISEAPGSVLRAFDEEWFP